MTLAAQGVKFVLQLGSTMILARLLTPADFGLVAMVTALTGFVAMFKDAGLSMATVQSEEITHEQVSTLFWINVALSILLMGVVAALAPAVAWFYGEPELFYVTLAIAGTFIFSGLSVQHLALLKRQMRFAALAAKDVTAMVAGVTVAVTLAWLGAGYWALVAMGATSALIGMIFTWTVSGWTPALPQRHTDVGPMLAFGGNLTGFNFLNYFARNADNVLIGWWWGANSLGFYTKAYSLLMMPIRQVNAPIASVAITALSRLQTQPARYRAAYLSTLQQIATVSMPVVAFAAATSDWAIEIALGPSWSEASSIFTWLALAAGLQVALNTTGWLFITQNRTREQLRWAMIAAPVTVLSFIAGVPWGPRGVAISYAVVNTTVLAPLLFWYIGRKGPVVVSDFYRAIQLPLTTAAVTFVATHTARAFFSPASAAAGLAMSLPVAFLTTSICVTSTQNGRAILKNLASHVAIIRGSKTIAH